MQPEGLVTLSLDAEDGRLRVATLSRKGREVHDQSPGIALESERARLSVLSESERETLVGRSNGPRKHPAKHRGLTFRLKHCRGPCSGQESFQVHVCHVIEALDAWEAGPWPYPGPVGIPDNQAMRVSRADCP